MHILYRIAPNPPNKSPFAKGDKFLLVRTCLKSFIQAFEDISPRVVFILDGCPKEYKQYILENVPFKKEIIETPKIGNFGTYKKQIEIAATLQGNVLLQEDDYLYLPKIGWKLDKAIEKFDFVTPQDEYLFYFNEPRHIGKYEIKVLANHHFREVNSTTLTFGAKADFFKENKDVFLNHGTADYPMWQEIRERGHKIWCPIPTFATHLVEGLLSPTINWEKIWSKLAL